MPVGFDFVRCPSDYNIIKKRREKIKNFTDLAIEIKVVPLEIITYLTKKLNRFFSSHHTENSGFELVYNMY